ncbi:MAG: flap endonuclease [Acidimicrobiia bacterium]|nr:flap endonuclease [Acidimicrobiia bacterium]
MKLHLLDGTYELFRSYFGAPKRKSPAGQEVGAIAGIISSTIGLLGDGVTHIGAAFDTVIESYRNDIYPGYKSSEGVPEEILEQFPLAERAMTALGVTVWPMVEYEADDAIGTAAHRWAGDVEQVVIMTPDKDLSQCVSGDHVIAFDRRKREARNEEGVWEKFGVAPASIPDYLGLVGDSADGLPGVPGWGAKSASTVLARYGHIESIPLEASLWQVNVRGAERLVGSLREHMAGALLYRYLATLRFDVPLEEKLSDLKWKGVPKAEYQALCDELGFDGLRERPWA